MLRRHLVRVSIAAAFSLALSPAARALRPVSAEEAPKANAQLVRALGEGAQEETAHESHYVERPGRSTRIARLAAGSGRRLKACLPFRKGGPPPGHR